MAYEKAFITKPELSRRNFLIGSSAAISVLMLTPAIKKVGILVVSKVPQHFRRVYDIMISCEALPMDIAVNHKIYRNNDLLFAMKLNARAAFRWVAAPKSEFIFREGDVFRYDVDNGQVASRQLMLISDDLNGQSWAENFAWEMDELTKYNRTSILPVTATA